MTQKPVVLVLGGGPDGEREISIRSATGIAAGLNQSGRYQADLRIIERIDQAALAAMPGDLILPYLHGPYGEGGPLQDVLEADGRPYFGSGPRGSRLAMDKIASKAAALDLGIATPRCAVLNTADDVSPLPLPVIVKPIHEGSTLGLHVCMTHAEYAAAAAKIRIERTKAEHAHRVYMVEQKVGGMRQAHELTVGLLDGRALPVIEIRPHGGLYDFEAKYNRNDTEYLLDPEHVSETIKKKISKATGRIAKALGLRHIARADFMIESYEPQATAWFLEINTTPGFTDHSLVPKAAAHAGISMPSLCAQLADMTLRDAGERVAGIAATSDDVELGEG